jgi:hypothetical protein
MGARLRSLQTEIRPQAVYAARHAAFTSTWSSLSPREFKAALYAKGWTMQALATFWGLSGDHVRRLAADPQRPRWWDNALVGLPVFGPPRAMPRACLVEPASDGALDDAQQTVRRVERPHAGPGFRYWGYMVVGAVVAVTKHLGELVAEDMHGIVLQTWIDRTPGVYQQCYHVIFESGAVEAFTPDQVDAYLATVGIERDGLTGYVWRGVEQARQDFAAGIFVFEGVEPAPAEPAPGNPLGVAG